MADSGDGVNSTSSGKEARGTIADGPITDPASSMKVNQAELWSNLKSPAVRRALSDVRANLTTVCHDCRICRRSHESIGERGQNARTTSPSAILPASSVARPAETKSFDVRLFLSLVFTLVSLYFSFIFSQCLSLPLYLLPLPSVSVILLTCVFFCLA